MQRFLRGFITFCISMAILAAVAGFVKTDTFRDARNRAFESFGVDTAALEVMPATRGPMTAEKKAEIVAAFAAVEAHRPPKHDHLTVGQIVDQQVVCLSDGLQIDPHPQAVAMYRRYSLVAMAIAFELPVPHMPSGHARFARIVREAQEAGGDIDALSYDDAEFLMNYDMLILANPEASPYAGLTLDDGKPWDDTERLMELADVAPVWLDECVREALGMPPREEEDETEDAAAAAAAPVTD